MGHSSFNVDFFISECLPIENSTHLKYGVVVYGGEVEAEVDALQPSVRQVIGGTLMDVSLGLALAVVRQPVHLQSHDQRKDGGSKWEVLLWTTFQVGTSVCIRESRMK